MSESIGWLDRLRIERVVWMLDQQLYDLPSASRVAKRREIREHLVTASHDVGTTTALRQLGTSSQLAHDYLVAELGDGPRHSWINASLFLLTSVFVLTTLLSEAVNAFGAGIVAADPAATGTYTWGGVSLLQSSVTFTMTDGSGNSTGGAMTPLCYLLLLAGTVLVGKLWRVPALRRLVSRRTAAADG